MWKRLFNERFIKKNFQININLNSHWKKKKTFEFSKYYTAGLLLNNWLSESIKWKWNNFLSSKIILIVMKKLLNQNVKTKEESKILAKLHLKSHESFNKKKKTNHYWIDKEYYWTKKRKFWINNLLIIIHKK